MIAAEWFKKENTALPLGTIIGRINRMLDDAANDVPTRIRRLE